MQTEISAPAFTLGALVMVTVMEFATALHKPFPVVVSVMVTLPAVVSALLGV